MPSYLLATSTVYSLTPLLLFEEPLPTLSSSAGVREYGAVRTGYSLNSALFAKPTIQGSLTNELNGTLSVLAARAVGLPDDESANNSYGYELNLSIQYAPSSKVNFSTTAAYFIPGNYFTSYNNSDFGSNFNKKAIGLQILGVAQF